MSSLNKTELYDNLRLNKHILVEYQSDMFVTSVISYNRLVSSPIPRELKKYCNLTRNESKRGKVQTKRLSTDLTLTATYNSTQ